MDAACGRRECGNAVRSGFPGAHPGLLSPGRGAMRCTGRQPHRGLRYHRRGEPGRSRHAVMGGLVRDYPGARFGFHGHTDRGFGVANARAAVLAGAVQVQGTLIGTGERCGNVNLTTRGRQHAAPGRSGVRVRRSRCADSPAWRTRPMRRLSLDVPHGAPDRGPGGIRHMGGHARFKRTQESRRVSVVRPARVGANPIIGVNAQSGRANVILLSETLGVPLNVAQAQALIEANQAMIEGGGYHRQRGLVPAGVPAGAQDRAGFVHGAHLAGFRRVGRSRQSVCAGVHVAVDRRCTIRTTRAEGAGPGGRTDQRDAARTGEVVPGHCSRCGWAGSASRPSMFRRTIRRRMSG